MRRFSALTGIRPQSLFVLFLLLIPLLAGGCSAMKGISMMQGGSTEQGMLMRDEAVKADLKAHLLTVKVRIDGSPEDLNFIIDTGALTIIDEQTAKRFTFKDSVINEVKDLSGNKKDVRLVQVNRISVGNIAVSNCAAAIVDLKKLSPNIDGILGSNFLKFFKVQIDYRNSSLTFLNNSGNKAIEDAIAIPIWKNMKFGFAPTMRCELDSVLTVDCMVDTGHDAIASLPLSIIRKLPHFKSGEFVSSNGVMGAGAFGKSSTESYLVKADKIVTGPLIIDDVPVVTNNSVDVMTLGHAYLKNFLLIIDYPNSVLYLKPYPGHPGGNKLPSFGFGVSKEKDKTIVTGVWKWSVADKSGLSVGDELIKLNGENANRLSSLDIMQLLKTSDVLNLSYIKHATGASSEMTLRKADLALLLSDPLN